MRVVLIHEERATIEFITGIIRTARHSYPLSHLVSGPSMQTVWTVRGDTPTDFDKHGNPTSYRIVLDREDHLVAHLETMVQNNEPFFIVEKRLFPADENWHCRSYRDEHDK